MVKFRKVSDFILSRFSHFASRTESALGMLEVEIYLQYSLLVFGNLGCPVRPYKSLYCAEQGHFPLCLCLLSI